MLEDLAGFQVDAFERVVEAAAFNRGPTDNISAGGPKWIAHVGLLENLFGPGARLAVGEELFCREVGALDAIDDVQEAQFNGAGESDAVVEVP